MDKQYKVSIEFEDIKSNKTLKSYFRETKNYDDLSESFKKSSLALLALVLITSIIIGLEDKLFSIKGMVDLIFISILYYLVYIIFYFLQKFKLNRLSKENLIQYYQYLIGEFNVILKDKKLYMKSEWKDITLNLSGCRVKNDEDSIVFIEKSGFIVMFPKNKFENFDEFKEEIISMRGNKNA
ncbi:hypothetical protein [Clostridium sp.]|uniref:hypothetical protein n=1 Tax=Clostridium sp. TaxID=1506 RepID=UPI00263221C2|nr:hypothetical protein [Clostridium sp.]